MLGLDEWTVDIQTASGSALTERLACLWEHREAVREHIQQALPPILAQSRLAGVMVAKDYAEYRQHKA
jgi:hypothetical protein